MEKVDIDGNMIEVEYVKKPWIRNSYLKFSDNRLVVVSKSERTMQKMIVEHRSGHGMAIAANKFKGIRASVCWNEDSAEKAKKDDDINVICLPAEMISANEAAGIVLKWLETPFESIERRTRRLKKIEKIEDKNFKKG